MPSGTDTTVLMHSSVNYDCSVFQQDARMVFPIGWLPREIARSAREAASPTPYSGKPAFRSPST